MWTSTLVMAFARLQQATAFARFARLLTRRTPWEGGPHQIILPPDTYRLTHVNGLVIGTSLTIIGSEASNTIIDGNFIMRSTNGVLHIPFGITVSISGVTIS
jgi:hypothetical protein